MATVPIKSLFGKLLGLTRASSSFPTERLYALGGFMGPAVYLSTSAGSEALVDIAGFTSVESASTGTAALSVRGITQMTSGASSLYTLAAPPGAGVRKYFIATSSSTAVRQVTSAAHIVRGVSSSLTAGDSGIIAASSAHTVLTFQGVGNAIELVSLSTGAWSCLSVAGYTSAATPVTTA